jgi:hypothetical protein
VAHPPTIVHASHYESGEIILCEVIFLQDVDALLVLKQHVEPNYHYFFQVRVRDLWVAEVFCYEPSYMFLVCSSLQASSINLALTKLVSIVEILVCSFKDPEHFKRDVCKELRHAIDQRLFWQG